MPDATDPTRSGRAPLLVRRPGSRRALAGAAVVVACLTALPAGAASAKASDSPRPAARQDLVMLLGKTHTVRDRPTLNSRKVAHVNGRRPLTEARTVLPVLARKTARGRLWLRVRLPGRKLGRKAPPRSGWLTSPRTRHLTTVWRIVVNVRTRRVHAYRDGRRVRTYRAIVGKSSTRTPRGEYFVEENVRLPRHRAGAPFALATSARSRVLQEFDGGPGQIALHGLSGLGGRLGTAVSHGCVRVAAGPITWLASRIRPGVPITVR